MSAKKYKLTKQSFMRGVLALFLSQVLVKLIGLIYKVYLTNKPGFGDAGNAIYNSGFQIYVLLLSLSSVGVPNAISKLVSEKVAMNDYKGAHNIFKVSFLLFSIIGLIGTLILFFGAHYIANVLLQIPEAELSIACLSPSVFFVSISSVIRGYFNGQQNMSVTANSQTLEQIFKTIFTIVLVEIIFIVSKSNIIFMAAGANLATTLSIIMSFLYLYKYYKHRKHIILENIKKSDEYEQKSPKQIIKNVLNISIPVSLTSIILAINNNIDAITIVRGLKHFLTESVAKFQYGIFSGKVDTLTAIPLYLNVPFTIALVPAIASSFAKKDKEGGIKKLSFCLMVSMLLGLPSTVGMIIFAQPILNLLFPNATEGAVVLQIISASIIFMMLTQTINAGLQGIGKYKVPVIVLSIGAVLKFTLNTILIPIPELGINGAALSSLICQVIVFIIGFTILNKSVNIKFSLKKFVLKPITATAIMSIISYLLYIVLKIIVAERIATIISLILAVIIYGISIIVLRVLNKEEINSLPYGNKIYMFLEKLKIYG